MREPDHALAALAVELRDGSPLIGAHVGDPPGSPALGLLCASGPLAAADPAAYALVAEAVHEGALLHYGEGRVVRGADPDLALLAGDDLYARALESLVGLGDLRAVAELAGLIALQARLNADGDGGEAAGAAWLAGMVGVGFGSDSEMESARDALVAGAPGARGAAHRLAGAARRRAAGAEDAFAAAADSIGFPGPPGA